MNLFWCSFYKYSITASRMMLKTKTMKRLLIYYLKIKNGLFPKVVRYPPRIAVDAKKIKLFDAFSELTPLQIDQYSSHNQEPLYKSRFLVTLRK